MPKRFKYSVYLIPIILLGYLFWQNTKPVLEMEYKIDGKTPLFSEIVPLSRLGDVQKDEKGFYRNVNKEPVYFDVRLPRHYNQVEVEIEYSDLKNRIFEVGVSRDDARKNFDFVALENKILDNLDWQKNGKELVLYQRNPVYKNIDEFLANPPKFNETLVYRADLNPKMKNFWAKGITIFNFPIKEKVKFAFYHDGGEINMEFDGKDVKTNLYQNGKILDFKNTKDFKEGVYIMEIIGNKDFVLESGLRIGSPYVAILDSIKIGKLKKSTTVYLIGSRLLARTDKAEGAQKLWINNKALDVKEPFLQYKEIFNNRNLKTIYLPKGNIELNGAIFFAKPYNLFYPRYEVMYPDINLSGINYILTKYSPPKESNGIKQAKAIFDIKDTPTPYNKLRLLLSLPNSEKNDVVKIRNIKLKFIGDKFGVKDIFRKIYYIIYPKSKTLL